MSPYDPVLDNDSDGEEHEIGETTVVTTDGIPDVAEGVSEDAVVEDPGQDAESNQYAKRHSTQQGHISSRTRRPSKRWSSLRQRQRIKGEIGHRWPSVSV